MQGQIWGCPLGSPPRTPPLPDLGLVDQVAAELPDVLEDSDTLSTTVIPKLAG